MAAETIRETKWAYSDAKGRTAILIRADKVDAQGRLTKEYYYPETDRLPDGVTPSDTLCGEVDVSKPTVVPEGAKLLPPLEYMNKAGYPDLLKPEVKNQVALLSETHNVVGTNGTSGQHIAKSQLLRLARTPEVTFFSDTDEDDGGLIFQKRNAYRMHELTKNWVAPPVIKIVTPLDYQGEVGEDAEQAILKGFDLQVLVERAHVYQPMTQDLCTISCAVCLKDEGLFPFFSAGDLYSSDAAKPEPVMEPILYEASMTSVEGTQKDAGKTALTLAISKAVMDCKPFTSLCLPPPKPRPVYYFTEESPVTFAKAVAKAGITDDDKFYWQSIYHPKAVGRKWEDSVDHLAAVALKDGGVLVIDNLTDAVSSGGSLEGDAENSAGHATTAMHPLKIARNKGLCIVYTRHTTKSSANDWNPSNSGRGSTAWSASVDTQIQLSTTTKRGRNNQRYIGGISRIGSGLPYKAKIEWIPEEGSEDEFGSMSPDKWRYYGEVEDEEFTKADIAERELPDLLSDITFEKAVGIPQLQQMLKDNDVEVGLSAIRKALRALVDKRVIHVKGQKPKLYYG